MKNKPDKIFFIGDNRNRENWGCRATSIALKELISKDNKIIHTLYGDIFSQFDYSLKSNFFPKKVKSIFNLALKINFFRRILNFFGRGDFIRSDFNNSFNQFNKRIKHDKSLANIYDKILECDAVVVNGEGSFIFSNPPRRDSVFYLILLKLGQLNNKKTYCLNFMISDCPQTGFNEKIFNDAIDIFSKCNLVVVMDKLYLSYLKKVNHKVNFKYLPDALFSWQKFKKYNSILSNYPLSAIPFPEWENLWSINDFNQPYICVSGSSSAAWDPERAYDSYLNLISSLKRLSINVYIVPTCSGDRFLEKVAKDSKVNLISVKTNILIGMSLLANSKVFISGRWHPSILSSLAGTPCVFLGSNSHKTKSLQEMMNYNKTIEYNSIPTTQDVKNIIKDVKYYLEKEPEIRKRLKQNANKLAKMSLMYSNIIN